MHTTQRSRNEVVLFVPMAGHDYNVAFVNRSIEILAKTPTDTNVHLKVTCNPPHELNIKAFPAEFSKHNRQVIEQLFSYGNNGETTPGSFDIPLGYLNVAVMMKTGEKHIAHITNGLGQIRYINDHCLIPLAETTTKEGEKVPPMTETVREDTTLSNALFLARSYLIRPIADNAGKRRQDLLNLLNTMRGSGVSEAGYRPLPAIVQRPTH